MPSPVTRGDITANLQARVASLAAELKEWQDKGRQQALLLQPKIQAFVDQPEMVVVSSQCRAIQTGLLAFDHLVRKVKFIAHEDVRECTGVHTCDKRRPKRLQEKEFPMVDFTQIKSEEDGLFMDDRRESKKEV